MAVDALAVVGAVVSAEGVSSRFFLEPALGASLPDSPGELAPVVRLASDMVVVYLLDQLILAREATSVWFGRSALCGQVQLRYGTATCRGFPLVSEDGDIEWRLAPAAAFPQP